MSIPTSAATALRLGYISGKKAPPLDILEEAFARGQKRPRRLNLVAAFNRCPRGSAVQPCTVAAMTQSY
jgi:hypothetical protein